MKYMGSKARIRKDILPIILKNRKEKQYYIEPFVGGCNMIEAVDGNRIAADNNKYLIAMFKGLQQNLKRPYDISKELYSQAREEYKNGTNIVFSDFEIGWIGWMASFNGRFFDGGYSGKTQTRDYISEQIRNTEKQIGKIKDINFYHSDYKELIYPDNSIIYLDPPYMNTKKYSSSKNFNYEEFWDWCVKMQLQGHEVFISEYNAPDNFEVIWEKEITNSLHTKNTKKSIEKLFKLKIKN